MIIGWVCFSYLLVLSVSAAPSQKISSNSQALSSQTDDDHSKETMYVKSASDLVEISEDKIPEGAWVMLVEEGVNSKADDLMTSDSIPFRPLFRYRAKQQYSQRRQAFANKRRRRFYTLRTPYRYRSHGIGRRRWHPRPIFG